jgi:hypothetical protein
LKTKPLWLVKISNKSLIKYLRDAFLILPAFFVLEIDWVDTEKLWENIVAIGKIDSNELIWFDFILCDNNIKNLNKYFQVWIVPIVSSKSSLSSILKEFAPMKNEWNSYIFDEEDKWSIFYALVRYLENFKFPFDNKNLVKNVLDI